MEQSIHERLHEISSAYGLDFSATVFIDGSEAKVTITEGTNSTIVELTTRALRSFLETWISRPSEKDAFVTGLIGCGELESAQKPNLRDQGVLDRSDAPRTLNHPRMLQALAAAAGVTALMVVGTSVAAHYTA